MVVHTISLLGKRNENEDEHFYYENLDGRKNGNNINFYGVYDGHGGDKISKYLKNHLSSYFIKNKIDFTKQNKLKKYIKDVYNLIQKKLDIESRNFSYTIGSTALVSLITKVNNTNRLYLLNLGDCRAVLCKKNNMAVQLTKDHKQNTFEEKTRIEQLGGKVYFDGYDHRVGNLSVSRSFGDIDSKPFVSHIPDVYKCRLNNSDKFMVLGCDGLWDELSNQEVVDFVLGNMTGKLKNEGKMTDNNIAKKLGEYAIQKGSTDNVSIIIKFF